MKGVLRCMGIVLAVCVAPSADAGREEYVGSEACGKCHPQAFSVWQDSAHARADRSLGQTPDARCLGCHTTGEAPAGRAFFGGVGCEACHGPGAGYAEEDIMRNPGLAGLLGLRDLSTPRARAALCAGCHRAATRLRPFDPVAGMRRIEHGEKPAAGSPKQPPPAGNP